jgi:acyl dehydratase
VRFTNQAWPGDTLDATAIVVVVRTENGERYDDLRISRTNQDGVEVIKCAVSALIDS